jgi:hypothetical protein
VYKLLKRAGATPGAPAATWLATLKSAMTLHRLMREVDPSFQEQLLRYQDRRGGGGGADGGPLLSLLNLDRYNDAASRETWDYSSWIRAYGSYLDERLSCFRAIRFDPESDGQAPAAQRAQQLQRAYREQQQQGGYVMQQTGGFPLQPTGYYGAMPALQPTGGSGHGNGNGYYGQQQQQGAYGSGGNGNGFGAGAPPPFGQQPQNLPPHVQQQLHDNDQRQNQQQQQLRTDLKSCDTPQLLGALPHVQRLLARMLACRPEGAAARHPVPLTSAAWVLRESRAVYRAASEGVMNLADKYFELGRDDALRALELYKRHVELSDQLSGWFGVLRQNPALSRAIAFPTLQPLPADFLTAMEEYARDAPLEGGPGTQMSPRTAAAAREALAALELPAADDDDAAAAAAALAEEEEAARRADEEAAMETVQEEEEEEEEGGEGAVGEGEAAAAAAEEEQQEPPPPPPPAPDLLSFDDEPAPAAEAAAEAAAAAAAAPAEPASELDALASGMVGGAAVAAGVAAGAGAAADGFGDAPPAFGAGAPQQQPQPPPPPQMYGAPPYGYQPTGPYGAPPAPYGAPYYPQYAPTGGDPAYYGAGGGWPAAGPTGGVPPPGPPGSMALVPVAPMGAAPMYGAPGGYPPPPYAGATGVNPYVPGLGPQGVVGGAGAGAGAAAGGASNPFNPFASAGGGGGATGGGGSAQPGPSRLTGQRLTNDPLNELTDQLFAAPAAPASPGTATAKGPSMRAMNATGARESASNGNGNGGGGPAA